MSFLVSKRDLALFSVSFVPFLAVNTGDARYAFTAAICVVSITILMTALAWQKPTYGWLQIPARILVVAGSSWAYATLFVDFTWDIELGHLGLLSQYVWLLGCLLWLKSRTSFIKSSAINALRKRAQTELHGREKLADTD